MTTHLRPGVLEHRPPLRGRLRWTLASRAAAAWLLAAPLAGCGDAELPIAPAAPAVCQAYALGGRGGVRVFAIQPRIAPEHFTSYEAFRGHIERLVDERVRPCLAADRPNLIVFPENLGLPAAFLGSRGADARTKATAIQAFLALSGPYAPAVDHYKAQWPDLALAEGLLLGLTDTLWRAFSDVARGVAASTGAYVIASTNVSGDIEESTDPADLAALRDPDLVDQRSVYVARDRAVYNAAYVFSPQGDLLTAARKPYLVPVEESQLTLRHGALRDVRPVDLGFAQVGILTSKDAWMPDVIDRLDTLGAQLFVQPEAFSGWGIEEHPGDWLPAVFQQSAWAATQKHGSFRHAVVPHLTGNLFDIVFDGQSALLADTTPGAERPAYVGQPPAGGFLALMPWIVDDPGFSDPGLSIEARRAALRAAGEAALPGGENENGYLEGVVAADLDPAAPFPEAAAGEAGVLGVSAAVAPAAAGEQTRPALAAGAGGVFVAWQDERGGRPQIYLARSADGGATFGAARAIAPSAGEQRSPALAALGGGVVAAWQERDAGGARVVVARSADGDTFGAPEAPGSALAGGAPPWDEWAAALAEDGGTVHVAFVALLNDSERVVAARSAGGGAWQAAPVDAPASKPPGDPRNNQWSPALAAQNGEVAVAWVDFRSDNWDVYAARSVDGGQTFAPVARIDDGTDALERLHNDPALVFLEDGALACGWSDVRLRQTPAKARVARIGPAGAGPSEVLGGAGEAAIAWRPKLASLPGGALAAVWQDFRTSGNDIYLAMSPDGSAPFGEALRVDDGGEGASYQLAPAIAAAEGGRVVVAWEDSRSGRRQIRVAAGVP